MSNVIEITSTSQDWIAFKRRGPLHSIFKISIESSFDIHSKAANCWIFFVRLSIGRTYIGANKLNDAIEI